MTLEDIKKRLEEIGINEFNKPFSKISSNPKHLKILFDLNFKNDIPLDENDKFWKFYKKYNKISNSYIIANLPSNLVLYVEYNDGELSFEKDEKIKDTWFYNFLKNGLQEFFDTIYNEI